MQLPIFCVASIHLNGWCTALFAVLVWLQGSALAARELIRALLASLTGGSAIPQQVRRGVDGIDAMAGLVT
jgi:hypothetical protein